MSKIGARTKGYFKNTANGQILTFQFNPSSIKTDRSVKYNDLGGCGSAYPLYEYVGGEGEEISFSLEIIGSVQKAKESIQFMDSLMPPKDTVANFKVPPVFYFSFGASFTEKCILNGLSKTHEDFDEQLQTKSITFDIKLRVVR